MNQDEKRLEILNALAEDVELMRMLADQITERLLREYDMKKRPESTKQPKSKLDKVIEKSIQGIEEALSPPKLSGRTYLRLVKS